MDICVHCVHNFELIHNCKKCIIEKSNLTSTRVNKNLTSKQKKVFDFIYNFLDEQKVSPTISELAQFLGVSSLRTVTQYLEALERKGLISRSRNQSRGIKLVSVNDVSSTITLPVVSFAGCDNMNVFAEQTFDEFITIDKEFIGNRRMEKVVAFRAVGDSMTEAGIETGDLVLTEMTDDVAQKDKVVAVVDGMALIKQIHFTDNAVILSPMTQDQQYRPIIMKRDFKVFGKVIDVIKNSFGGEELTYETI